MPKLKEYGPTAVMFWCPGCDGPHAVGIHPPGPQWTWNGSDTAPTFTPSVLATYDGADADTPDGIPSRCHSYVTDGRIQFLADCSHQLVGQTVDLPDWEAHD